MWISIQTLEEIEAPSLLFFAEEGGLLDEVVGSCVWQTHWKGVAGGYFMAFEEKMVKRSYLYLSNCHKIIIMEDSHVHEALQTENLSN